LTAVCKRRVFKATSPEKFALVLAAADRIIAALYGSEIQAGGINGE